MNTNWFKVIKYFKTFWYMLLGLFLLLLLNVGLNLMMPLVTRELMDHGLIAKNLDTTLLMALILIALAIADGAISIIHSKVSLKLDYNVGQCLYEDIFKKLGRINISFFRDVNSSEVINQINTDVDSITSGIESTLIVTIIEIFRIIGGMIGLLIISPFLAIIVLVYTPIKYSINYLLAKKTKKYAAESIKFSSEASGYQESVYRNMEDIRIYNMLKNKTSVFMKKISSSMKADMNLGMLQAINTLLNEVLVQIFNSIIYILGVVLIIRGDLTVGGTLAFLTYATYVISPIGTILDLRIQLAGITPSIDRFMSYFDIEEEQNEGTEAPPKDITSIEFCSVDFGYDNNKILNQVDFSIKGGEKVAIVGQNGSGKTTIIRQLLRFYNPDSGVIKFNSIDIKKIDLQEYRNQFSYVNQNITLTEGSIIDNISTSNSDKADCVDLIEMLNLNLPEVNVNQIGSNGLKLSGGQRQKIALARALASKRKVIILDEPTSNTDSDTLQLFKSLLSNDLNEKIVIVITHDISLLSLVDKVIYIKNGAVIDYGEHKRLLEENQQYKDYLSSSDYQVGRAEGDSHEKNYR